LGGQQDALFVAKADGSFIKNSGALADVFDAGK